MWFYNDCTMLSKIKIQKFMVCDFRKGYVQSNKIVKMTGAESSAVAVDSCS